MTVPKSFELFRALRECAVTFRRCLHTLDLLQAFVVLHHNCLWGRVVAAPYSAILNIFHG